MTSELFNRLTLSSSLFELRNAFQSSSIWKIIAYLSVFECIKPRFDEVKHRNYSMVEKLMLCLFKIESDVNREIVSLRYYSTVILMKQTIKEA